MQYIKELLWFNSEFDQGKKNLAWVLVLVV